MVAASSGENSEPMLSLYESCATAVVNGIRLSWPRSCVQCVISKKNSVVSILLLRVEVVLSYA